MINFHNHYLDEQEIIGVSDFEMESKKKLGRVSCFVYFKNYPVKLATVWETGKVPHRLSFLSDHLHLTKALEGGDIDIYKKYKAAATEKFILKELGLKRRRKDPAPMDKKAQKV